MFKTDQLVRGNKSGSLFHVLSADGLSVRVHVLSGKYAGARARLSQFSRGRFTLIGNNYKAKG